MPRREFDPSKPLRRTRAGGDRERFCQELLAGTALYEAYELCGLSRPAGNAQRLEQSDEVVRRIDYLREKLADSERTMLAMRRIKMRRMLDDFIEIDRMAMLETKPEDWTPAQRALIEGRKVTQWGVEYLMPSKLASLAQLAKLDGFEKAVKMEMAGPNGSPLVTPIINLTGRPEPAESTGANNG